MTGMHIGYTGKVLRRGRCFVHERIVRYAYPRNGNAAGTTAEKAWDVYATAERKPAGLLGVCRTLREAGSFAAEYDADTPATEEPRDA